jgi:hypothetical protein
MTALPSTVSIGELVGAFQAGSSGDPDAVKSCCAAVYGVDLVALLLGESYHPGVPTSPDTSPTPSRCIRASGSSTSPPASARPRCSWPRSATSMFWVST